MRAGVVVMVCSACVGGLVMWWCARGGGGVQCARVRRWVSEVRCMCWGYGRCGCVKVLWPVKRCGDVAGVWQAANKPKWAAAASGPKPKVVCVCMWCACV